MRINRTLITVSLLLAEADLKAADPIRIARPRHRRNGRHGRHEFLLQGRVGARRPAPEATITAQTWTFTALALTSAYLRDGLRIQSRAFRYGPFAALALFGAFLLLLYGLQRGPASVLVPVAQMSFVITALAGVALFHERLDARKGLGLAVAAAALVLFAVS